MLALESFNGEGLVLVVLLGKTLSSLGYNVLRNDSVLFLEVLDVVLLIG